MVQATITELHDLQKNVRIKNDLTQNKKLETAIIEYGIKKTEAKALMALGEAEGVYLQNLLKGVGGRYADLKDYLIMKNSGDIWLSTGDTTVMQKVAAGVNRCFKKVQNHYATYGVLYLAVSWVIFLRR